MSNRRKPRGPARRSRPRSKSSPSEPDAPVAKIRGPADALAMIPYLLGFEPHESVVIVSLEGPRRRLGQMIRIDLCEPRHAEALISHLAGVVEGFALDTVLVAAFSSRPTAADAVVPGLVRALDAAGVVVQEALRADGAHWWSYTCDRGCCPAEGTPYDPASSSMSAFAVASGLGKAPSREALSEQFAPRAPELRQSVGTLARAIAATVREGSPPTVDEVDDLLWSALGHTDIDPPGLGILLGVVQDLLVRDIAWLLMTRADAELHFELWRQVMTAADDDLLPPAGSLCAFAAWLSGRGAVAATAIDRVAEVAPDYRMLRLIRDALESGLSPDYWDERLSSVGDRLAAGGSGSSASANAGAGAGEAAG